jgi:hypothetical protein
MSEEDSGHNGILDADLKDLLRTDNPTGMKPLETVLAEADNPEDIARRIEAGIQSGLIRLAGQKGSTQYVQDATEYHPLRLTSRLYQYLRAVWPYVRENPGRIPLREAREGHPYLGNEDCWHAALSTLLKLGVLSRTGRGEYRRSDERWVVVCEPKGYEHGEIVMLADRPDLPWIADSGDSSEELAAQSAPEVSAEEEAPRGDLSSSASWSAPAPSGALISASPASVPDPVPATFQEHLEALSRTVAAKQRSLQAIAGVAEVLREADCTEERVEMLCAPLREALGIRGTAEDLEALSGLLKQTQSIVEKVLPSKG